MQQQQPQQRESKPPKAPIEDETEKMRAELLRKEKELLELKKKEIDLQLAGMKAGIKHHQVAKLLYSSLFLLKSYFRDKPIKILPPLTNIWLCFLYVSTVLGFDTVPII